MTIQGETLTEINLFRVLSMRDRSFLSKLCRLQRFSSRQQIVTQDKLSRNIHFILSGRVKVSYHTTNGREVTIWKHSKGDALDLYSLMNGKFHYPRATDITPVVELSMRRREFNRTLLLIQKFLYNFI